MTQLLSIDGLEVRYRSPRSDVVAVKKISLEIAPGETVGLVGDSGCGKSSVAFAIMNYLGINGWVSAGTIQFDGAIVTPAQRGGDIAMVYQEPSAALNPSMKIGDQLAEVPMLHEGLDRVAASVRVAAALNDVHLTETDRITGSYPHQLSGGQLQRVVIAMALLGNPRLILMDEPTTALDPTVESEIMALIAEIQSKTDAAILFISHNLALVHKVCRRVVVMEEGTIAEEGPVEKIYRSPTHSVTQRLLAAVPDIHGFLAGSNVALGDTLIDVADVSKRYQVSQHRFGEGESEQLVANANISFTVRRGEIVAIVGESGGGKSTLVKMLMGLERVSEGTISVEGRDVGTQLAGRRPVESLRIIQMVFQNPGDTLNPTRKIGVQLARVVKKLGSPEFQNDREARVAALLESVQLSPETAQCYPGQLSGGQRQRVAIARALAAEPEVIVADEPLSALDVSVQAVVVGIFKDLRERAGLTLVFISHDLATVRQLADRVLVLQEGRIVEQGVTDEVFTQPRHAYTEKLLAAVPTITG